MRSAVMMFGIAVALVGCSGDKASDSDAVDTDLPATTDDPTAEESCNDGLDDNGDGLVDCSDPTCSLVCDADQDGANGEAFGGGDCDDDDASIFPLALEICDDIDNDCDDLIDDDDDSLDAASSAWYADMDGDGFGWANAVVYRCDAPAGSATQDSSDCDDGNPNINPLGTEVCNGADDNCDGLLDEADPTLDPATLRDFWVDLDGDGFGDPAIVIAACAMPVGYAANGNDCDDTDPTLTPVDNDGDTYSSCTGDCNDNNAAVNALATEICNGGDDNCDGLVDEADPNLDLATLSNFYYDYDGDGYGDPFLSVESCLRPSGYAGNGDDCDDTDATLTAADSDGDGYSSCTGDCDDTRPAVNANAPEVCNGFDDDCDLLVDEADPSLDLATLRFYYLDFDGDGYGDPAVSVETCLAPSDHVTNGDDCDDNDAGIGLPTEWWLDADGDGVGAGAPEPESCVSPGPDYLPYYGNDCDDLDPLIYPGAYDVCGDYIDTDCNGSDCGCVAFAQPSYAEDISFPEPANLDGTRMAMAWDGVEFWPTAGGSATGNTLASEDAAGVVSGYYQSGIDMRSVFTQGDGIGPIYARGYASPNVQVQVAPGVFTNAVALIGGSLDAQSAVVWDDNRAEFVALTNGVVYRWDAAGNLAGSVTLVGFGNMGTESAYPQNRGVAWACDYYLTYSDGTLSAWDSTTGVRLSTTTLTGAGTSFDSYFSFSYADGRAFVVDGVGGLWRGYDVL